MHSFKQEDLIPYIYGEVSNDQANAIRTALESDWNLREQYEELVETQVGLNKISYAPRKNAIDFIMNYAGKSVSICTTES